MHPYLLSKHYSLKYGSCDFNFYKTFVRLLYVNILIFLFLDFLCIFLCEFYKVSSKLSFKVALAIKYNQLCNPVYRVQSWKIAAKLTPILFMNNLSRNSALT